MEVTAHTMLTNVLFPSLAWLPYIAAVLLLIVFIFIKADADISLLLLEKFGKPVRSLEGKVAWVTGAASGIGREMTHLLANHGVKLVISDLRLDQLQKVKDECLAASKKTGPKDILVLPFDLTSTAVHQECVDKVVRHFGKLDVVFHNAACTLREDYTEITEQVDRTMFDVNCFGHVALSRLVLKQFLRQGSGHFVVTSSSFGKYAYPRASTYVASKHAIIGYFNSLQLEYATKGVDVTVICPGPVFSGLYDKTFTGKLGQYSTDGMQPTDRRMAASRCAYLMLLATANKVEEAWPSLQPALTWLYLNQYAPTISKRIAKRLLNSEMADGIRDGRKRVL